MRLAHRSAPAVEPQQREIVPGLAAARRAAADARQGEVDLALETQAYEVEKQSAALVRGRVASRVAGSGGKPPQADIEEVDAADAVIANVPARVAILQDTLRFKEAETKDAGRHVTRILEAELQRRAPAVREAAAAEQAKRHAAQRRYGELMQLAAQLQSFPRPHQGMPLDADVLLSANASLVGK